MQGANIFLSAKIRIHALDFTPDGLGMASEPFVVLDPDSEEAILESALLEALDHSRDGVPSRALTREEEQAYYEALDITSHKDLGRGADILRVGLAGGGTCLP